jgi:glyoxylate/hydroxypyruvate reductase A
VHTVDRLPDLVADADWIVLSIPDTPSTRGLVSRETLSRCRGAVLLNAGRGAVVDEAAIPEALDQGWLRGAALDVFATEPLPAASPLWNDPRILVSPHISGLTTVAGAADGFLECVASLEQGVLPKWTVDRARGY